jgi:tetratricopeptide (TPR) repeat protein
MYTLGVLGAAPLLIATLCVAAPDVKNPALAEGIRLYEADDYAGALQSLTQALDRPSNKSDAARIHLYIGLIQHRYKLKQDAEASFGRALDYDPKIKLPKGTPAAAKTSFKRIKKEKLGIDDDAPPEPIVKKKKKKKESADDPDPSEETRTETSTSGGDALAMREEGGLAPTDDPPPAEDFVREQPRENPDQRILPNSTTTELGNESGGPIGGWISIGVGAAAAATGITFGILSVNSASASDQEPVASRSQELYATAVEQRTVAIVSFGGAVVAIGIAAVLFLTD